MNESTAWNIVVTVFQAGRELQKIIPHLKAELGPDEYHEFMIGIATTIDSMHVQLLDKVLKAHPDLEQRIEQELATRGQVGP